MARQQFGGFGGPGGQGGGGRMPSFSGNGMGKAPAAEERSTVFSVKAGGSMFSGVSAVEN